MVTLTLDSMFKLHILDKVFDSVMSFLDATFSQTLKFVKKSLTFVVFIAAATDIRYFARSTFSRSLDHKKFSS